MKLECKRWIVFVVCSVLIPQKCLPAVIISSTPGDDKIQNNTPLSTSCTIQDNEVEAYCLPIRNCLTLLMVLNATAVRARRCGPHNENLTNPYVCCEKTYIDLEATLASGQKSSTASPEQELETVTSSLQSPWTTRPPQQRPPISDVLSPERELHKTVGVGDQSLYQECGHQEISSRILGGKPSSQKEFPWLARLLRRDNRGEAVFSCTGSLVSPRVVLTTAHCLVSDYLKSVGDLYAVSFGEHETECSSEANECLLNKKTIMISKYIAHSQYNLTSRNHDNDIGLVILRKNVPFSDYIAPICLLESDIDTTEYYISGWGKTETGAVSGVKLKAELPSFAWDQCSKKYSSIKIQLTSHQICAGGIEGTDSCQGDSGGPLMVRNDMRWYVAGVVSFGVGCGRKGWPAVYIYVPTYIDWIKENVRQNTPFN